MSGCNVALKASRYRQYALLLAGLWVSLVFLLLPLAGASYGLAALLLTLWFYLLLRAWPSPFSQAVLSIDEHGALHWQYAPLAAGQLSHRGLITNWLLQLDWQDAQGERHRLWLFKDQLTAHDYRALARQLQLQRWRAPTTINP